MPPVPDLMFEAVSEAVEFGIGYRALAAPVMAAIARVMDRGTKPVLVGVSGRSRAGKSAIAHAVIRSLTEDGILGLHARLDDWIMSAPERAARPRPRREIVSIVCCRARGLGAARGNERQLSRL